MNKREQIIEWVSVREWKDLEVEREGWMRELGDELEFRPFGEVLIGEGASYNVLINPKDKSVRIRWKTQ